MQVGARNQLEALLETPLMGFLLEIPMLKCMTMPQILKKQELSMFRYP